MSVNHHSADTIVIGAGLHGACAALHIAETGRSVTLLDKGYGGETASIANASGVRRLMRATAELPLAMLAADRWRNLSSIVGSDGGYREVGQVKIAETADELRVLAERAEQTRKLGYSFEELIDPVEVLRLIPELKARVSGALLVKSDGLADPFLTTKAYLYTAIKAGVDFRPFHSVTDIQQISTHWNLVTNRGTFSAETIVNCAGAWGAKIAGLIGDCLPLKPEAPSMMVTESLPPFIVPVLGAVSRKLSFKQMPNGTLLIGGGYRGQVDEQAGRSEARADQLQLSANTLLELFPQLRGIKIVRCWSGFEGHTPDGLPIIGSTQANPSMIHAFGFSSHGFQLGPIVGKVISQQLAGETVPALHAFSPERFSTEPLSPEQLSSHPSQTVQ